MEKEKRLKEILEEEESLLEERLSLLEEASTIVESLTTQEVSSIDLETLDEFFSKEEIDPELGEEEDKIFRARWSKALVKNPIEERKEIQELEERKKRIRELSSRVGKIR